ncbi:hypothetical protein Glove_40g172 [Diversispora epigaea]|uniref:Protein kinase domain-containing protein n=1 Tax=Diversispora epigaea TaxID=1348612 RepID=A0A397JPL9_9GLOM|nr:hypothetical protein Glove_40g172 [Diversispora epigaea]
MNRFRSVEYLSKVGFGKVHSAMRSNGYIKYWNHESKVWHRVMYPYNCLKSGWEIIIYGITFNLKENEYMMVLRYEFTELTWKSKIKNLLNVIVGLAKIHEFGLMHKDLHSENNQEKIYGVIPFMAPETFRGEYTQKSGIYSFSIIMLEVFTSYPPYYNVPHDANLVMDICKGLKPVIKCEIPQLLKDLMGKCWDSDPFYILYLYVAPEL